MCGTGVMLNTRHQPVRMCELEGSGVSDEPSGAVGPRNPEALPQSAWQSSPPGSIYDYIRVASFSLGPDGRIEQWSERAAEFFGVSADDAVGRDPISAFAPAHVQDRGHERLADILNGREWTGLVPYNDASGAEGLA